MDQFLELIMSHAGARSLQPSRMQFVSPCLRITAVTTHYEWLIKLSGQLLNISDLPTQQHRPESVSRDLLHSWLQRRGLKRYAQLTFVPFLPFWHMSQFKKLCQRDPWNYRCISWVKPRNSDWAYFAFCTAVGSKDELESSDVMQEPDYDDGRGTGRTGRGECPDDPEQPSTSSSTDKQRRFSRRLEKRRVSSKSTSPSKRPSSIPARKPESYSRKKRRTAREGSGTVSDTCSDTDEPHSTKIPSGRRWWYFEYDTVDFSLHVITSRLLQ